MFAMYGVSREIRSKSSSDRSTPQRPAMASRCTTALVDPPMAMSARIAFSKASRVRILSGVRSSCTISTARRPLASASWYRLESTAGMAAPPGSVMPSASAIEAIVEAVPMTVQCPALLEMQPSTSAHCSSPIFPARRSSKSRRPSVPEPRGWPCQRPESIGPPVTMIDGIPAEAAPISWAGVVLSQPHSRTTPSIGFAVIDSSTSIDMRLRKSIVVGFMNISPSEMVGNSKGTPPAAQTPRLTASATSRRCALQFVSSDHELQIPMTGRPSKAVSPRPSERSHARRARCSYWSP